METIVVLDLHRRPKPPAEAGRPPARGVAAPGRAFDRPPQATIYGPYDLTKSGSAATRAGFPGPEWISELGFESSSGRCDLPS